MHGTRQDIGISSNPSGAIVMVDGSQFGKTPVIANLQRGKSHVITIHKDGYEDASLTTSADVSGWVWGNILFGGLIGLAVDAIGGGLYTLNPATVNANLQKSELPKTE